MADDIVTRLGTPDDCIRELLSGCICDFIGDGNCRCCRAAEMIERLRAWNVEITKLLQQAQVCMDIWQKSEDELIEFHQGKSIEALTEQANEIERLRAEIERLKNDTK